MLLDIRNPPRPGTVNREGDAEGSATCDPPTRNHSRGGAAWRRAAGGTGAPGFHCIASCFGKLPPHLAREQHSLGKAESENSSAAQELPLICTP